MTGSELGLFLLLVAFASFIQSVTGFALGLVLMGVSAALGLADIVFTAAVVSFIALVNSATALPNQWRGIDRSALALLACGFMPLTFVGLWLLDVMSASSVEVLRLILGVVVALAGGLLLVQPGQLSQRSGPLAFIASGSLAGVIGGMFGAGGAALAYLMYRQPDTVTVIRATLLACFVLTSLTRIILMSFAGHVDLDVMWTTLLSLPVVIGITMITTRFTPAISDLMVRRAAFLLLIVTGLGLVIPSVLLFLQSSSGF